MKTILRCHLEVKKFVLVETPFGHYWSALIIVNDRVYTAIRQGNGLNFWAFLDRQKFCREDQKYIDEILDEEMREEQRLNGEIA